MQGKYENERTIKKICESVWADWPNTRDALIRSGNFKAVIDLDPVRINFKTTERLMAGGLIHRQDAVQFDEFV